MGGRGLAHVFSAAHFESEMKELLPTGNSEAPNIVNISTGYILSGKTRNEEKRNGKWETGNEKWAFSVITACPSSALHSATLPVWNSTPGVSGEEVETSLMHKLV